LYTDVILFW